MEPKAFTEKGLYMLATVLKSPRATATTLSLIHIYYKDPSWGEASATYYAEYSANSFTPNENYSYSFDSLVLRMTPSGHFWGDTLTQQRISVYRLKQPIYLDDDEDLRCV